MLQWEICNTSGSSRSPQEVPIRSDPVQTLQTWTAIRSRSTEIGSRSGSQIAPIRSPHHCNPPGTEEGGGSEKSKYMRVLYGKLLKKQINSPSWFCWEMVLQPKSVNKCF